MTEEMLDDRIRVFLVDDEVTLTKLTKMNLERDGRFHVHTLNQASHALEEARAYKPDIMLLDVMMPDGDGGDLAASMKEDPVLKNVPVIFITAAIRKPDLAKRGGRIGGRPYLAKPTSKDEIITAIENELSV